ncbi:fungal-specific transcription factor domain protein [Aspergillus eucalypticola CBS 122712]|uniref:Fungal-specific transcription factor domain protein n=1 Tax=Aspergillus eucalypticola (strain CBS 122712 / IBT 29274) TaxID=1448314 RepID=A0A317VKS6_ASPEC|nr:fungal-specific transcription factor domain protein [Aspergillus eucalypticola CBS 122712]PWY74964.1 fungal-specific transcription factor domain protein [Aspergillus eucalypticola CBS 122712]
MATGLAARGDSALSPDALINSGRRLSDTEDSIPAKRPRRTSDSPVKASNGPRQKITRACDHCKEKKTRCTGTLPCVRCMRLDLSCQYNAAYSRGLPPDPLPAPPSMTDGHTYSPGAKRRPQTDGALGRRRPSSAQQSPSVPAGSPQQPLCRNEVSQRNSPDPAVTDFEGNYLGPASGVSFLNRVWCRLHQDERHAIPDSLENESSPRNTSVFMFGDKPYSDYRQVTFSLPPFDKARELVNIYFDFSMVTYRFLHRGIVEEWLCQVYLNNVSSANPPTGPMVVRTAIILVIFAVGTLYEEQKPESPVDEWCGSEQWYAASKYMSSLESGPPRLETVQARLGQCLYLLSTSRANECWYSFGTALQLVTALGLHRKFPDRLPKGGNTYMERELRKRILWSAYMLDRYLSVMFGRPRLLHDEDIDQDLPDEINDEDMLQEDPERRTGSADCMMIASILHFKLGRILGDISRQLYTVNPSSRSPPLEMAARLTSRLEEWKATAPPIFNGVRATSLIPPLCRQSQVLQLAYSHAVIHATRSFLLNDISDLRRKPPAPHPVASNLVRKCVEAAQEVMELVEGLAKQNILTHSFWFTHYVCFCAITVVYIYIIQQHRDTYPKTLSPGTGDVSLSSLFRLAETCQQHLAEATRKNCPSRRYSIILEELRKEVHQQIGPDADCLGDLSEQQRPKTTMRRDELPIEAQQIGLNDLYSPISLDNSMAYSSSLQPAADLAAQPFGPDSDVGFIENLEGSVWWTELDSWAFTNLPGDPLTLGL